MVAVIYDLISLPFPGSFGALRELTEEERQQILHSSEFQSFFDCSIRVVERALAEDGDIFFDYSGRDLEDKDGSVGGVTSMSLSKKRAGIESSLLCHFRLFVHRNT